MAARGSVHPHVGAGLAAGAVRIALGVLWLSEGITKYRAGFGSADIGLVVQSTTANPRVPGLFVWFAEAVMDPLRDVFGILMPLLETGLGVLLILGVLTLPAALVSTATLLLYWSADQLITQYPVMLALSAVVLLVPAAAARYGVGRMLRGRRRARPSLLRVREDAGAGPPDPHLP